MGRSRAGEELAESAGRSRVDDAYWTWKLFHDGYTADQVAAIRNRNHASLAIDLVAARAAGHEIDPILDRNKCAARTADDRKSSISSGRLVTDWCSHYN